MTAVRNVIAGLLVAGTVLAAAPQRRTPATGGVPETFTYGGLQRKYALRAPASVSGPAPLLVVLHGGGSQDDPVALIREMARFDAKADEAGTFVLYPYAIENYWNDGRGLTRYRSQSEDVDDVGFVTALVDYVAGRAPIDLTRVYVTGASNGAMMAYRLACERPDRFAAVAAVAGNLPAGLECRPRRGIPVVVINGTDDPLMPWDGGEVRFGAQRLGRVLSAQQTADRWAVAGGCRRPPTGEPLPDRAPRDGTRVFRVRFDGCASGADVVLYRVEGGGHTWPGGPQLTSRLVVGRTSRDLDATEVIWDFFATHTGRRRAGAPGTFGPFGDPQRVDVAGYQGHVMEPAVSRDGRVLVFNDMSDSGPDKNLFWARRVQSGGFEYMGPVAGANTPAVDISPSLGIDGTLFFTSLRSYPQSAATLYQATLVNGGLSNLRPLGGELYRTERSWASLDPDVTPDGRVLVYVLGQFGSGSPPRSMDIRLAARAGDAYQPDARSAEMLARINTADHLEYAPAISADALELFFTRGEKSAGGQVVSTRILRAVRASASDPFGAPEIVEAISGFVEGPSLSADGLTLYYHRKDGSRFVLYRVIRQAR